MSDAATKPEAARTGLPLRLIGAVALAAAGFGTVVGLTAAAGHGQDLHTLRVAVTLVVLLAASPVLVSRRLPPTTRATAAAATLVLAATAWWLVPSDLGGRSLREAAAQRDAMLAWLDAVSPDDVNSLVRIRATVNSLATDYPTLCWHPRAALSREILEARQSCVDELRDLSATDPAGFARTAPARRALVDAFPESKTNLIGAEVEWAARWARFTAVGYTESDMTPAFVREGCRNGEKQLLEFPTLDDTPGRLLEARRTLFRAAHECAEKEIRALLEHKHFDRAFGVALAHQFAWVPSPGVVGPEERKELDALVEQCRSLRKPGGDPDAIPAPRAIETGPEPRTVGDGDGT